MEDIQLKLDDDGQGAFFIIERDERVAEMVVGVKDGTLTAYHTEVSPILEGKGVAKLLLKEMVDYARENKLKVLPLCPFVHAQFKRHPDEYADIWQKE